MLRKSCGTRADADSPEVVARRGGGFRCVAVRLLRGSMEAIVLAMVALSPWAFGAVEPESEFVLFVGVAALLALWGARMLLEWRLRWASCPVGLCLGALYIGGMWQLTPLPGDLLARVSPATARMANRYLPSQPETLPLGEEVPVVDPPPGSTISLDPGGTKSVLLRLLAVFLLFAAVRTNIDPAAGLRRLSLVALVDGGLLALLGLVQFLGSPGNLIYWRYPAAGSVFGPFVNRNHFAFYMNICIGLGVGLLLFRFHRLGRQRGGARPSLPGHPVGVRWGELALRRLLDPPVLGMGFALALMVSSVVLCLSRGGSLALLGGSLVGLIILLTRPGRSRMGGAIVLPLALGTLIPAAALVAWLGIAPVSSRLATVWDRQTLQVARSALWTRTLPLMHDFPLWGTGYGTFRDLEPLHATGAAEAEREYVFAHNDYLEAMVEGGLARLIPSVAAVMLVFGLGGRAIRRHEGRSVGGLALGAIFGFTTVVIHSACEFGLHIPAIAVLATVVCAYLSALGGGARPPTADRRPIEDAGASENVGEFVLRLGGLAPLVGAATAVALGLVLVDESSLAARAEPFRRSAARLHQRTDPASLQRRLADLEAAARLMPEDARLQVRLANAHLALYEDESKALEADGTMADDDQAALDARHRAPALGHYLRARDLCPILPEPQLGIATHIDLLERSEPRVAYLERAKRLAPADPLLWYLYGLEEHLDGQPERAWRSWRRCLELSDRHRTAILDVSTKLLGPADLVRRVLPDRPDVLLAAAEHLHPRADATEARRPFLEAALALLERRPAPLPPEDLHLKARLQLALGRPAAALTAYEAALASAPLLVDWRFEFARLLHEQGHAREAHREVLTILAMRPDHAPTLELREAVASRLAETQ